jgi:hypothetical protein
MSRAILPKREDIGDETPLRLAIAVELAFPGGGMTVHSLRREIARGTLEYETIAGKQFTTLGYIKKMEAQKAKFWTPEITGQVYFIGFDDYLKIGYSADTDRRIALLQVAVPKKLVCYLVIPGSKEAERRLHDRFRKYRLNGEWFSYSDEIKAFVGRLKGK